MTLCSVRMLVRCRHRVPSRHCWHFTHSTPSLHSPEMTRYVSSGTLNSTHSLYSLMTVDNFDLLADVMCHTSAVSLFVPILPLCFGNTLFGHQERTINTLQLSPHVLLNTFMVALTNLDRLYEIWPLPQLCVCTFYYSSNMKYSLLLFSDGTLAVSPAGVCVLQNASIFT